MITSANLFFNRKRRLGRKVLSRYSALIASPFDLGTVAATGTLPNPFVVPESTRFAISLSAGVTAGQLRILTSRGRTIATPTLVANRIFKTEFMEIGVDLEIASDVAGTVSLYIVDGFGTTSVVASGVFT